MARFETSYGFLMDQLYMLRCSQAETEALYANINNVYNLDTKQPEVLKKPFRIELRKSIVVANYRVYYIGVSVYSLDKQNIEHTGI